MARPEENLDDVIASLIDQDFEDEQPAPPVSGDKMTGDPVRLTARAAREILRIREREKLDENLYLRVAVEGGGCAGLNYRLGFDFKNEEDTQLESEGIPIVVDPRHLLYLDGIRIDYPDGLDARGFTFENPNAVENCGCGSSFAI